MIGEPAGPDGSPDVIRALRERESELRAVLANVPLVIARYGPDLRYRFMSDSVERHTGVPASAYLGKTHTESGMPADLALRFDESLQRVFSTGEPDSLKFTFEIQGETRNYASKAVPEFEAGCVVSVLTVTYDITDEKRAAESEQTFQRIFESRIIGVIFWDLQGGVQKANQAFLEMLGFTREDLQAGAIDWWELTPPEWRDADRKLVERVRETGSTGIYEKEFFRKDGSRIAVLMTSTALEQDNERGVSVVIDITGWKRAEQALEQQLRLTRAITDNAASSLFIMDERQYCVFMNPSAEALTGYTMAEVEGRPLHEVVHHTRPDGSHYPVEECPIDRAFPQNNREKGEEVFVRKDGSFYPVTYTASPIREGGRIRGTVIEVQDLSDRRRAQVEIRRTQDRYRFLAESIPQMVWTATPDGTLDHVSGQATRYFGVPARELLGNGWLKWVHPADQPLALEQWTRSLESGEPYEVSFRLLRGADDCYRWHLVRAVAMRSADGTILQWFGTCTDIQHQKETEAELVRANRELEEFAYVASHDLKEPLRMVNSYAQLLVRRACAGDPNAATYARFIETGVMRMQALIEDLLAFSRVAHGETERDKVNLNAVVEEVLGTMAAAIAECGAEVTTDAPLPEVLGDRVQLTQVIQNLIGNSCKYRDPARELRVRIGAERRDSEWLISVADNGCGFQPIYAERIFGLFKRLHGREVPGTGVGLGICRRIIERHGGRIWAESAGQGYGCTVRFTLPA